MNTELKHEKFERKLISSIAILSGILLLLISVFGPLILDIIKFRTSISGINQTKGQDLVNLLLLAPICFIGGISHLKNKDYSKYFLIVVPIYISLYTGLAYGIGQEWGNIAYDGNVEEFFWMYLLLIISGLILFISSISMFSENDAPEFNPKNLKIYAISTGTFLFLFAMMWLGEIMEVLSTGNTSDGSYQEIPNLFWVIRYLDLGITIPLGFIGLYLLVTRPKKAYPLMLAFYGFFVTLVTAVLSMALIMILNDDPALQAEALIIFPILGILAYLGFFYLIKDKIRKFW